MSKNSQRVSESFQNTIKTKERFIPTRHFPIIRLNLLRVYWIYALYELRLIRTSFRSLRNSLYLFFLLHYVIGIYFCKKYDSIRKQVKISDTNESISTNDLHSKNFQPTYPKSDLRSNLTFSGPTKNCHSTPI